MSENEMLQGWRGTVGIGIEDTEGTAVDADLWFDVVEDHCRTDVEYYEHEGLGQVVDGSLSREEQSAPAIPVKLDNRVGGVVLPRFDHLLYLIPLALGDALGGTEYTPGNTPKSFTVEANKAAEAETDAACEQYAGGKLGTLTLESEAGGPLKATWEGVARVRDWIAGTTVDYSAWATKPPMMHHGLTIQAGPDEVPTGAVYKLSIEIAANLSEASFANSLTRIAAEPGRLVVTGTLTVPFNDTTAPIKTKIEAGTRFDLRPQYAGSDDETFDLYLSCKAQGDPVQLNSAEGQQMEIRFRCYQTADTHAIRAVLGS